MQSLSHKNENFREAAAYFEKHKSSYLWNKLILWADMAERCSKSPEEPHSILNLSPCHGLTSEYGHRCKYQAR